MKFYYRNVLGDNGVFSEKNLIKAIYAAWNIDAELYLINKDVRKLNIKELRKQAKLIFSPLDENEFNNELLEEFGYHMEDGEEDREIKEIKTGRTVSYDWSEVRQLI